MDLNERMCVRLHCWDDGLRISATRMDVEEEWWAVIPEPLDYNAPDFTDQLRAVIDRLERGDFSGTEIDR